MVSLFAYPAGLYLQVFTFLFLFFHAGMTQETQSWNGQSFLLTNPTAGTWRNSISLLLVSCIVPNAVANTCCPFISSGSMEFAVPATDPSSFFPISVGFSASSTFSDLKVGYLLFPLHLLVYLPDEAWVSIMREILRRHSVSLELHIGYRTSLLVLLVSYLVAL